MDIMDSLRILNIILSVAATWTFVATTLRRWPLMEIGDRAVSLSFAFVLVSIGYGSGEALKQDVPFGLRIAMMTASLGCLLVSLWLERILRVLRIPRRHQ